jgi:hypothetical protein
MYYTYMIIVIFFPGFNYINISMTGRGRATARLESDIQVSRDESNWRRVIELAEQLKTRSPNLGKFSGVEYNECI